MKVFKNNLPGALKEFSDLRSHTEDWRLRTYSDMWIQRIKSMQAGGQVLLDCGTRALAEVLRKQGEFDEATTVLKIKPDGEKGHSLAALKALSSDYKRNLDAYRLDVNQLSEINLPAIVQIPSRHDDDAGHYWILEDVQEEQLILYDAQIHRRFRQSKSEFAKEWKGNILLFDANVSLSQHKLSDDDAGSIYGGCCGVQAPESELGEPENNPSKEGCAKGAPVWTVNPVNMNFFMKDIPLWYSPAYGPRVELQLSYNAQSAIANNEPFGNKWSFNYSSYLVIDPGERITVFMPDGARKTFEALWVPYDGSDRLVQDEDEPSHYWGSDGSFYETRIYSGNVVDYEQGAWKFYAQDPNLSLVKAGRHKYVLNYLGGDRYTFDIPDNTNSMQQFLVSITDNHDQSLTLHYNDKVQLSHVKDATGKETHFVYDENGHVIEVKDPFGRSARFEYDAQGNLVKLTDMAGYWTALSYDNSVYLKSYTNELGSWKFVFEVSTRASNDSNRYPAPGGAMWENYRITVIDPLEQKEEYYYDGYRGESWHVSPENYIEYVSGSENNLQAKKTLYRFQRIGGRSDKIREIIYPDGTSESFTYDVTGNQLTERKDGIGNTIQTTYNELDRPLSVTDEFGRVTTYAYHANNIDVATVTSELGTSEFTFNEAHQITHIKNLHGDISTFIYNHYGQLTSNKVNDELTIDYIYDEQHHLKETRWNGDVVENYIYDTVGRVASYTDASGLTLSFDHNALNTITKITYPDGKTQTSEYSRCPRLLDRQTERSGQSTSYTYDALKRVTQQKDLDDTVVGYVYDGNDDLKVFVDKNQNMTRFTHNSVGQVLTETFSDNTKIVYTYNTKGLLHTVTDARNIVKTFSYTPLGQIQRIIYSDDTPSVTYTYEDDRIKSVIDGTGTYVLEYDEQHRLTTIDGPWENDTITYSYNSKDQLVGLSAEQGSPIRYQYNAYGKLIDIGVGSRHFQYEYTDVNPQLRELHRPSSVNTYFQYDLMSRLTKVSHKKQGETLFNEFEIEFNDQDNIKQISSLLPMPVLPRPSVEINSFNVRNQLVESTKKSEPFVYDPAGNLVSAYTKEGYRLAAFFDAENRMTGIEYTDSAGDKHTKRYVYRYDNLLSIIREYKNDELLNETRIVRNGFLAIQERNQNNSVISEYLWGKGLGGIGGLLSVTRKGQHYEYLYDHIGNVSQIIDSNQSIVAQYQYTPFGDLLESSGSFKQPFQYSTKRYDESLGFSYFGFRFYWAAQGRWVSSDPIGLGDGPNTYAYVHNNPLSYVDPTGEFGIVGGFIGGGIDLGLQLLQNGGNFKCVNWGSVAGSAALGAVTGGLGAVGGRAGLTAGLKGLSNKTKGKIGEALSYGKHRLRGNRHLGSQQRIPGQRSIADHVWQSRNGSRFYNEAKFGTSGLTKPQRAARKALGSSYVVDRWTYPGFGNLGAGIGRVLGGAAGGAAGNAASGNCGCTN